jgi:hypothetical protein
LRYFKKLASAEKGKAPDLGPGPRSFMSLG